MIEKNPMNIQELSNHSISQPPPLRRDPLYAEHRSVDNKINNLMNFRAKMNKNITP
jgi:hypothetical protein